MLSEIIWNSETLAVVFVSSIPMVGIIAGCWYKIEKAKSENDLKRNMVERDMSVEEIERVLAAKGSRLSKHR